MLPKFEIGTLVSREFPPYKGDESGFYRELCERVGKVCAQFQAHSRSYCTTEWAVDDTR